MLSPVTGLLSLVLLLNQQCFLLLRLQVLGCSTFHMMCGIVVYSIAVFCSEAIECFSVTDFQFFFLNCLLLFLWCQLLLVWPCIACSTFILSLYKLVFFSFFSACFCMVSLSAPIITSTIVCVFSVLFLIMHNCCICHCFHLITVKATNVIGLLYIFGYRASSQLSVSMEDRNSANHEKSW